jgi:hypothetical protein
MIHAGILDSSLYKDTTIGRQRASFQQYPWLRSDPRSSKSIEVVPGRVGPVAQASGLENSLALLPKSARSAEAASMSFVFSSASGAAGEPLIQVNY